MGIHLADSDYGGGGGLTVYELYKLDSILVIVRIAFYCSSCTCYMHLVKHGKKSTKKRRPNQTLSFCLPAGFISVHGCGIRCTYGAIFIHCSLKKGAYYHDYRGKHGKWYTTSVIRYQSLDRYELLE